MIQRNRVRLFARVMLPNLVNWQEQLWLLLWSKNISILQLKSACCHTHNNEHEDICAHLPFAEAWNFRSKLPKFSWKHHCCGIKHLLDAHQVVWPSLSYEVPFSWQNCCLCNELSSFGKDFCLCFPLKYKYKYNHNYKHKQTPQIDRMRFAWVV